MFFILLQLAACGGNGDSGGEIVSADCSKGIMFEIDDGDHATGPKVAFDVNGNALAMWSQKQESYPYIWRRVCANYYTAGTGWGTTELIEDGKGVSGSPQIVFDKRGNAIVVWERNDGGFGFDIWTSRYIAGVGWVTAELIDTDNSPNLPYPGIKRDKPSVAIDAGGNAIAVWQQKYLDPDSSEYIMSIRASRYVDGVGWGSSEIISTGSGTQVYSCKVAMDSSGNAIAVWRQYIEDANGYIWANRYVAGAGWGSAELVGGDPDNVDERSHGPRIAMDDSGNAILVWFLKNGERNNMWSRRYTIGTGWGVAELIQNDDKGHAADAQIVVDTSGNAITIWSESDDTRYNIWVNLYINGAGWSGAELIETDDAGDARHPQVTVNADGNAFVVWSQSDGTRDNIWANRYDVSSGWDIAWMLEDNNTGDALVPHVSVDASGNAIAVWSQSDGTDTRYNIWAKCFY